MSEIGTYSAGQADRASSFATLVGLSDRLEQGIVQLEDRLSTVLQPEYAEPTSAMSEVRDVQSPIDDQLDALRRKLNRLQNVIDRIVL